MTSDHTNDNTAPGTVVTEFSLEQERLFRKHGALIIQQQKSMQYTHATERFYFRRIEDRHVANALSDALMEIGFKTNLTNDTDGTFKVGLYGGDALRFALRMDEGNLDFDGRATLPATPRKGG